MPLNWHHPNDGINKSSFSDHKVDPALVESVLMYVLDGLIAIPSIPVQIKFPQPPSLSHLTTTSYIHLAIVTKPTQLIN